MRSHILNTVRVISSGNKIKYSALFLCVSLIAVIYCYKVKRFMSHDWNSFRFSALYHRTGVWSMLLIETFASSVLLRSADNEAASAEPCAGTSHSSPQTGDATRVPRKRRQTDAPPPLPATHSRPAAVSEREWPLRLPLKKPQDTSDCAPIDRVPP